MKNGIWHKLRGKTGATMLMALLLMLVGLMVSAVILSAAVSTVSGVRTGKVQQQAYLTVDSAVEAFRSTLEYKHNRTDVTGGDKYLYEIVRTQRYTNKNFDKPIGLPSTTVLLEPRGGFQKVMKDAMDNIIDGNPLPFHQIYQITVDEDYAPVTLDLTLTPVYTGTTVTGGSLEAYFYTSAEDDTGLCRMRLTADAVLEVASNRYEESKEIRTRYGIYWTKASVETPKTAVQGGND